MGSTAAVVFFLFAIFIIGTLLDWLLIMVENGSWFTLVNIAGHAFVSTAIVAAFFIFYRDRYTATFVAETAPAVRSEPEQKM